MIGFATEALRTFRYQEKAYIVHPIQDLLELLPNSKMDPDTVDRFPMMW